MEWTQFVIFFIGVFTLFVWNRTESRTDNRHMDSKLEAIRNLVDAIREESIEFREKWYQESVEFHRRLEKQDADFKEFVKDIQTRKLKK